MGEPKTAYQTFVEKLLGKFQLVKTKKIFNNIKMDLREVGCEDGTQIELQRDHVQWWAFVLYMLNPQLLM